MTKSVFRFFLYLFTILIFISCAGAPPKSEPLSREGGAESQELPSAVIETLELYEDAVRKQDPEIFTEVVVGDVTVMLSETNGQMTDIRGMDTVSKFRLIFFDGLGPQEEYNFRGTYGPMIDDIEDPNTRVVGFRHDRIDEWFHLTKQTGDNWLIQRIEIYMHPPGEWVTNRYQLLSDSDGNGYLNADEHHNLIEMTSQFYEGTHTVSSAVDKFFDRDDDGFINGEELFQAAHSQFVLGAMFIQELWPGNEVLPLEWDLDGNDRVSRDELEQIRDFMVRGSGLPLDRWFCADIVSQANTPDALFLPVPREAEDLLDKLADGNGNGIIEEEEQDYLLSSLAPAWKSEDLNPLNQATDQDKNGIVSDTETMIIMYQSAIGRGASEEGVKPPFEVRSPTDEMLDINGDKVIGRDEIEIVVEMLAGRPELIDELSLALQNLIDRNQDGRYSRSEIDEGKARLIFPRPVEPDSNLDIESDVNRDGFIDPNELGITAGMTNKGAVPPFEDRIMIVQHRVEMVPEQEEPAVDATPQPTTGSADGSEYYRKLGTIQDTKLAVVSLDIGTEQVDDDTAKGLIMFVENAFVNVGEVKVVDRAHIEQISEEAQFQLSGLIDEETAVEIGKLSGADIIVVGSINRVGDLFYLNIKLIAVETGQIIGSSIAQAHADSEFLEMANQAVYKLF